MDKIKRVLVTNFFSHPLPLIRYALDDILDIQEPEESISGYRILKSIQGRADDYFTYQQNIKVHPMVFRHVLGQYSEIIEYQVFQTEKGADINFIASEAISPDTINLLCKQIKLGLGKVDLIDSTVNIKQIAEIKRHDETGKFRRFVPLL